MKRLDSLVFFLCLLVLIFNQLAFGGVHIWAATLSQLVIFGLIWLTILLTMPELLGNRERVVWKTGALSHPVLPFMLIALTLAGCQLLSLDPGWVSGISARTCQIKQHLLKANVVDELGRIKLSLEPFASQRLLIEHVSQVLFFVLLLLGLKNRPRVLTLITVLLCLALFQVFYGLLQTFSATQKIWWWQREFGQGWLSGTYINRNHLAGFLELTIPLSFGLGLAFWPRDLDRLAEKYAPGASSLKKRALFFEQRFKSLLFIALGVFLGVGLLLSGSRGGIICLAAGTLIVSLLFVFKRPQGGLGLWLGLFLLIIAVYGIQVGIEATAKRFDQPDDFTRRLKITAAVAPMVTDYPLTGVGLGNFQRVYPEYELASRSGKFHYRYAHNDWVQAGAEFGVPGLILALSGYVFFLVRSLRLWLKTRDQLATGLGAGLLIGYIALGIHSFFDFNLHIPANILSFAACLALLHAVLSLKVHRDVSQRGESGHKNKIRGWPARMGMLGLVLVIGLILVPCSGFVLNNHRAEALCPTIRNSTIDFDHKPPLNNIRQAIEISATNPAYREKLGRRYLELIKEKKSGAWPRIMLGQAEKEFAKGLELSPADAYLWLLLGETRARLAAYQGQRPGEAAVYCLKHAVELRPKDYRFLSRVAAWMLWMAEQKKNEGDRGILRSKAFGYLDRGIEQNPASWIDFVDLAWSLTKDKELILEAFEGKNKKIRQRVEIRVDRIKD